MKTKQILVAGAAGFLGSNLVAKLLRAGYGVIGIDNLSSGNRSNIDPFFAYSDFRFMVHDIVYPIDVPADIIINLASPASALYYQFDPLGTLKTTVVGTLTLLELAKKYGARFVQASTSDVYGDATQHPQGESYWGNVNPVGAHACYAESKRVAEAACFDYKRLYNLDVRVARIFNTYGPRMSRTDCCVVTNFIVRALQGKVLEVYGDGQQTRSFCFVDDLIDAFIRLIEKEGDLSGPINLGGSEEITILSLARMVIEISKNKVDIVFKDLPLEDPTRRRPALHRAKELLGWTPKTTLNEGLERTVDYFRKLVTLSSATMNDRNQKTEARSLL